MIGMVKGTTRQIKQVAGLPAPIASFQSNVSGVKLDSLKVLVEAQQDLHGYDKPWAGGAGKNLFDKTAISNNKWLSTTTGLEENASGYCVSDFIKVKGGQSVFIPTSGTSRRWFYDSNKNPKSYLNNSGNQAFTPTEDGYIRVTIQITGSTPVSLDTYQIEAGSTATSYEPYENICPITGWSGANVTRTGKNLFVNANPILGRYLNDSGGQILGSGWNISDYIPIKGGQTYHFKPNSTLGGSAYGYFYTADLVASTIAESRFRSGEITITAPSEARYVRFSYRDSSSDIQLEIGSQATAYVAPLGNTYTIAFGDTYYGCELDVTNGVLRVVKKGRYVDSELSISYDSTNQRFFVTLPDMANNTSARNKVLLCSTYENKVNVPYEASWDSVIYNAGGDRPKDIAIHDRRYTTVSDFVAYTSQNCFIVYPLATPIEIQLTPQQIAQLAENNIWADTGDVSECKYSDRVVTVLFSKG